MTTDTVAVTTRRSVTVQEPVVITGCGVVSPAGVGLDGLKALMDGTVSAHTGLLAEDEGLYPPVALRTVPGDVRLADYIRRKGTRRLDRMTGFGLIASHLAMESAGLTPETGLRDQTGVAVGTTTGSLRSVWEVALPTYRPGESYVPSRFPNSVLNSCAGQIAVWNSLKAVNSTLASGHLSSTSAVRYALNTLRWNRARSMLVGGVEELSPQLAWGWHRSGALADDAVLGEGAAILVAEHRDVVGDRPVLAELLGAEIGYAGVDADDRRRSLARGLAHCVTRLLERTSVAARDVSLVSLGSGGHTGARRVEEYGLRLALGSLPELISVSDVVGDTYSASGALQAAAVLARWSDGSHPEESYALISSAGPDGSVGCFLLRRATSAGRPAAMAS